MMGLSQVIMIGNLTRDLELRYTPKGTAVGKGGIAINRVWTTEGGEKKEDVTFVDFEAWGRTAETLGQYTRKGDPIFLSGRLQLDQWEDKQTGQAKSKLKVVVEGFRFLKSGGGSDNDGGERPARPANRQAAAPAGRDTMGDGPPESDDVPF